MLRIICDYRTVSEPVTLVMALVILIDLLTKGPRAVGLPQKSLSSGRRMPVRKRDSALLRGSKDLGTRRREDARLQHSGVIHQVRDTVDREEPWGGQTLPVAFPEGSRILTILIL